MITTENIVIIGNGMVGHYCAEQLVTHGLHKTHAIHIFGDELHDAYDRVHLTDYMSGQDALALRLHKDDFHTHHGLTLHRGVRVEHIDRDAKTVDRLVFADGTFLETDLVVFSAGIRPQDRLARECGLAIGSRGGVVIDDTCRTSDAAIFAIGECACWNGQVFGLVAPGYTMARTVASILAGEQVAFAGADMSTKLKLLGVDVGSIGDAHGRTPGCRSYRFIGEIDGSYRRLVLSEDGHHVLGAVLVGDNAYYDTILQCVQNDIKPPADPAALILPRGGRS